MDARFKALEPALQRWAKGDFNTKDPYPLVVGTVVDEMGDTSKAVLEMIYKDHLPHNTIAQLLGDNVHSLRHQLKWIRQEIVERVDKRMGTQSRRFVRAA